jgi:hypothetical protein
MEQEELWKLNGVTVCKGTHQESATGRSETFLAVAEARATVLCQWRGKLCGACLVYSDCAQLWPRSRNSYNASSVPTVHSCGRGHETLIILQLRCSSVGKQSCTSLTIHSFTAHHPSTSIWTWALSASSVCSNDEYVGFEVFAAVTMKNSVFSDVIPTFRRNG